MNISRVINRTFWFVLIKISKAETHIILSECYPKKEDKLVKRIVIFVPMNFIWKYIFMPKLVEYNKLALNHMYNDRFYFLEQFLCENFISKKGFTYFDFLNYKYVKSNNSIKGEDFEFTDEDWNNIINN